MSEKKPSRESLAPHPLRSLFLPAILCVALPVLLSRILSVLYAELSTNVLYRDLPFLSVLPAIATFLYTMSLALGIGFLCSGCAIAARRTSPLWYTVCPFVRISLGGIVLDYLLSFLLDLLLDGAGMLHSGVILGMLINLLYELVREAVIVLLLLLLTRRARKSFIPATQEGGIDTHLCHRLILFSALLLLAFSVAIELTYNITGFLTWGTDLSSAEIRAIVRSYLEITISSILSYLLMLFAASLCAARC